MSWCKIWTSLSDIELDKPTYMWAFYEKLLAGFELAGKRVLELGCGTGFNSLMMAKRGAIVTLLDSSSQALAIAKTNFARHGLKAKFVLGNALKHNLKGFDLVHSEGLIEHFRGKNRQLIINSHSKAVKSGGKVIIVVPNSTCLFYRFGKWLGNKTRTWLWGNEWPYSSAELKARIAKAGLKIENIKNGELFSSLFWPFLPLWSKLSILKKMLSAPANKFGITLNYGINCNFGRVLGIVAKK
jgi:2-polyprenyl-3-methyl-5-hydroxy-6-metoxy-1,4-benzoquinol methylase